MGVAGTITGGNATEGQMVNNRFTAFYVARLARDERGRMVEAKMVDRRLTSSCGRYTTQFSIANQVATELAARDQTAQYQIRFDTMRALQMMELFGSGWRISDAEEAKE